MEFRIQKSEFLKGLRIAQSIADRKSTMPMLANVLLRTSGKKKLLVAATDLNVSISAELTSKNSAEGGLTVGAKALFDIVANMPEDDVVLRRTDNNWAEISCGKVKYRLVGMPDRDFPKVPEHSEAEFKDVEAELMREMIDRTLFSVCNDETRFHLNGVLFESDGSTARMVSTDGHRLSKVERTLEGAPALTAGIIIPKKGIGEIKKLLESGGKAAVAVKTPYIFVHADSMILAVKLIESQFPPYEQVIPKEHTREVVIDRQRLLSALKRAQLMSSETRGVKFNVSPDSLVITSDNPDIGEVREELEAQYDGEEVSIGFNPKYVIDLLSQMATDQVTLELNGELDPGLLRPFSDDNYLGVVMPMRI
ncbi:DNA polymerase III subunit beta [Haliangium ochraceum]|uniref:Beta sliding clamp n=1 Tax=Haliangium ochraceum (strain DSM 14365 / JCM 11303 / SMP-2) TaxID=502025 RepID=D0LFL0_HALO1|nr:DNA polymerase III subunit beta [Haliangium ochraceum]ACY12644.1 DNA polymerase III, beta subunit [Haliangium ochraceum DSM 14365]